MNTLLSFFQHCCFVQWRRIEERKHSSNHWTCLHNVLRSYNETTAYTIRIIKNSSKKHCREQKCTHILTNAFLSSLLLETEEILYERKKKSKQKMIVARHETDSYIVYSKAVAMHSSFQAPCSSCQESYVHCTLFIFVRQRKAQAHTIVCEAQMLIQNQFCFQLASSHVLFAIPSYSFLFQCKKKRS